MNVAFKTVLKERESFIRRFKDLIQDLELHLRDAELDPKEHLEKASDTLAYLKLDVEEVESLVKSAARLFHQGVETKQ